MLLSREKRRYLCTLRQFIIYVYVGLYLWGNINLFLSLKTRWREQNAKQLRVVNIITIEKKNFKKNWINLISCTLPTMNVFNKSFSTKYFRTRALFFAEEEKKQKWFDFTSVAEGTLELFSESIYKVAKKTTDFCKNDCVTNFKSVKGKAKNVFFRSKELRTWTKYSWNRIQLYVYRT